AGGAGSEVVEGEPLGLLWDRDRWYLIGRKLDAGESAGAHRYWRADRIVAIERSTFRSRETAGFDVRHHLGRTWLGGAMTEWAKRSPVRIPMGRQQAARPARALA